MLDNEENTRSNFIKNHLQLLKFVRLFPLKINKSKFKRPYVLINILNLKIQLLFKIDIKIKE